MIAILAAICVAAWLLTRFLAVRMAPRSAGGHMQIVERLGVAQDKVILLIRVGDKGVLVGVSKQQMNMLGEVPLPQSAFEQQETPASPISPLLELFDRLRGKGGGGRGRSTSGYAEDISPDKLPPDEREKLEEWAQRRRPKDGNNRYS